MDEREFVTGAQDLLHSEFFAELERHLRQRSIAKFEASAADDELTRNEAYHELGALRSIRRELENRIAKFKHESK
tara:strand:- start:3563 stop:3787 length:225 start_codon:yes stop_codon:yes gene_type:complete